MNPNLNDKQFARLQDNGLKTKAFLTPISVRSSDGGGTGGRYNKTTGYRPYPCSTDPHERGLRMN